MNEGNGVSDSTRIWYQVLNKRKARKKKGKGREKKEKKEKARNI